MFGTLLGEQFTEICASCGSSFVDHDAMRKIEARAKATGI